MKMKVICWLLACAILLTASMPAAVFATETETDPTTQTETTDPTEESTDPTEESSDPTEESSDPTEESTDPTEDSTDPTEESTDPTEESTDPTEEGTDPTEESTDPTEESSDPTEESTEPTEETTAPTEPTEPEDTSMRISDEMLATLKGLEGCRLQCYWDYKQYSVGYGSRCPETVHESGKFHTITEERAEELLLKELVYFEKEVNAFIERKGLTLTQQQYDTLVSFSYNCGANWTTETTGYFHNAVLSGDLGSEFVYGMFLWGTAGGQYVLIPRRICETYIYVQGIYNYKLSWYYDNPQYRYVFMDANGGKVNYYVHGFDVNDPTHIRTQLTSAPVGPDETGGMVTYVFDGWYTARVGGTKVEVLDDTMTTGTVLYAHWKTPAGTPVVLQKADTGVALEVTVTANGVNYRSGAQTYFAVQGQVNKGDKLILNEIVSAGGYSWGRFGDNWIRLDYTDYNTVTSQLFPYWGRVTGEGVNVRAGAGLSYDVVMKKNKGDMVQILRWVSDGERMWGQTAEGYIAMNYVVMEEIEPEEKVMTSIAIVQLPGKLQYLHMTAKPDLTGGLIEVFFSDGTSKLETITEEMISGFDSANIGTNTITVTYEGLTAQFDVEIIKAKVVFLMDDGSVLSEAEYLVGETLVIPAVPEKPSTKEGIYVFVGWGQEVTTCTGDATYTAVFELVERMGDINKDGRVNDRDVFYLLDHILFPEDYPFAGTADLNGDGRVNDRDIFYLLDHILFPEDYPLPEAGTRAQ